MPLYIDTVVSDVIPPAGARARVATPTPTAAYAADRRERRTPVLRAGSLSATVFTFHIHFTSICMKYLGSRRVSGTNNDCHRPAAEGERGRRRPHRRILVATSLDAVVAAIAHAAGASREFSPLKLPSYTMLTAVGILGGALGWAFVRRRASHPRALLLKIVPIVLAVSFVPDVLVGTSRSLTGTSWGAVAALNSMHLVVAAVGLTAYLRVLPIPRRPIAI